MTTVTCPVCGHTETGENHHPHDAMTYHYRTHRRAARCGCQWQDHPTPSIDGSLRVCEAHEVAYLRERTEWRLANYYARVKTDLPA